MLSLTYKAYSCTIKCQDTAPGVLGRALPSLSVLIRFLCMLVDGRALLFVKRAGLTVQTDALDTGLSSAWFRGALCLIQMAKSLFC
jgi:hypothetical protein